MRNIENINSIDFEGASIVRIERNCPGESLEVFIKQPGQTDLLHIKFNGIKEEKAELYIKNGIAEINTAIPPVDVIETFESEDDLYRFGGYINSKPWAVWEFMAESYEISRQAVNKQIKRDLGAIAPRPLI